MRGRSGSETRVSAEAVRRREGRRKRPSGPRVAQRDPRARPTPLKLDPYAAVASRRSSSPHEIVLRRCKLRTPPRIALASAPRRPETGKGRVRTPHGHTSIRISSRERRGAEGEGLSRYFGEPGCESGADACKSGDAYSSINRFPRPRRWGFVFRRSAGD